MKTSLLFLALLLFTQDIETSLPARFTYTLVNSNDFCDFNFLGWNNTSHIQLLLKNNAPPLFIYNETFRVTLPRTKEDYWQDVSDNIFIGHRSDFYITPDSSNTETDSEIKIHQTDSLLYYTELSLPGC